MRSAQPGWVVDREDPEPSARVIDDAFINLRRIGGHAVHRAGIFAAAGIVALESGMDQLGEDIVRAQEFARATHRIGGLAVDPSAVETNIVMVDIGGTGLVSRCSVPRKGSGWPRSAWAWLPPGKYARFAVCPRVPRLPFPAGRGYDAELIQRTLLLAAWQLVSRLVTSAS